MKFTAIDQNGEFTGQEVGRVWAKGEGSRWEYVATHSLRTARDLVKALSQLSEGEAAAKWAVIYSTWEGK